MRVVFHREAAFGPVRVFGFDNVGGRRSGHKTSMVALYRKKSPMGWPERKSPTARVHRIRRTVNYRVASFLWVPSRTGVVAPLSKLEKVDGGFAFK